MTSEGPWSGGIPWHAAVSPGQGPRPIPGSIGLTRGQPVVGGPGAPGVSPVGRWVGAPLVPGAPGSRAGSQRTLAALAGPASGERTTPQPAGRPATAGQAKQTQRLGWSSEEWHLRGGRSNVCMFQIVLVVREGATTPGLVLSVALAGVVSPRAGPGTTDLPPAAAPRREPPSGVLV